MKLLNIKENKSTLLIFLRDCMLTEKNVKTNVSTFEKKTFAWKTYKSIKEKEPKNIEVSLERGSVNI